MSFNTTLGALIENNPTICFSIFKELIDFSKSELPLAQFLKLERENNTAGFLSLVKEIELEITIVSSVHILEKCTIHEFFVSYILNHHWHSSYKLREDFFTWIVKETYYCLSKTSYFYNKFEEIQEFEKEILIRINSKQYAFIPDDSILFNLKYYHELNPEDNSLNHIYWFSRYLKDYGRTANVGQFYTKCLELLFGKTKTPASIMFEFEAKVHLSTLLQET
jgi:hypothetical protein